MLSSTGILTPFQCALQFTRTPLPTSLLLQALRPWTCLWLSLYQSKAYACLLPTHPADLPVCHLCGLAFPLPHSLDCTCILTNIRYAHVYSSGCIVGPCPSAHGGSQSQTSLTREGCHSAPRLAASMALPSGTDGFPSSADQSCQHFSSIFLLLRPERVESGPSVSDYKETRVSSQWQGYA